MSVDSRARARARPWHARDVTSVAPEVRELTGGDTVRAWATPRFRETIIAAAFVPHALFSTWLKQCLVTVPFHSSRHVLIQFTALQYGSSRPVFFSKIIARNRISRSCFYSRYVTLVYHPNVPILRGTLWAFYETGTVITHNVKITVPVN